LTEKNNFAIISNALFLFMISLAAGNGQTSS
jgi:hypothetical protein